MKTEKIVLSFIAILVGLLVAFIAFFIYQSTKAIPPTKIPIISLPKPTAPLQPTVFLSIDNLQNESVTDKKILNINGKTNLDATIILSTLTNDQVVSPATNGNFSLTTSLNNGVNQITIIAIGADGTETKKTLIITYTTEQF